MPACTPAGNIRKKLLCCQLLQMLFDTGYGRLVTLIVIVKARFMSTYCEGNAVDMARVGRWLN